MTVNGLGQSVRPQTPPTPQKGYREVLQSDGAWCYVLKEKNGGGGTMPTQYLNMSPEKREEFQRQFPNSSDAARVDDVARRLFDSEED